MPLGRSAAQPPVDRDFMIDHDLFIFINSRWSYLFSAETVLLKFKSRATVIASGIKNLHFSQWGRQEHAIQHTYVLLPSGRGNKKWYNHNFGNAPWQTIHSGLGDSKAMSFRMGGTTGTYYEVFLRGPVLQLTFLARAPSNMPLGPGSDCTWSVSHQLNTVSGTPFSPPIVRCLWQK